MTIFFLSGIFPCCDQSEYLVSKRESSKYFYIRENSIEYNEPQVMMKVQRILCMYTIVGIVETSCDVVSFM